ISVPGFATWGSSVSEAINYWGGVENIPQLLADMGHTVIVPSIGPISSNWERACELYAQLTSQKFTFHDPTIPKAQGTRGIEIDYGTLHQSRFNYDRISHNRKAAIVYTKSPNDWENWVWSKDNPVHFICHSHGGNTVRYLIHLMEDDSRRLHPNYFNKDGKESWTISVVTLGTPHRGTTLTDIIFVSLDHIKTARIFTTLSFSDPEDRAYDLQLDHWSICRHDDEPFLMMRRRLEAIDGPVRRWIRANQHSLADNSIVGVNSLHRLAPSPSADVLYFTLSFNATAPFPQTWRDLTSNEIASFPLPPFRLARKAFEWIPLLDHLAPPFSLGHLAPFFSLVVTTLVNTAGQAAVPTLLSVSQLLSWFTGIANKYLTENGFNIPRWGICLPRSDVLPLIMPSVRAMGGHRLTLAEEEILGSDRGNWYLNDGIVNTASMQGPLDPDNKLIKGFSDFPGIEEDDARGIYWHLGVNNTMDHADEIGIFVLEDTVRAFHLKIDLNSLISERVMP
ncbi:alpha/beta-hydrolase, partial [Cadophora sp. DSE1049]